MVGEAGERAGRDHLLLQQRGAALGLGLGAALRQAVVVDLVLLVGNLLAEPGGTTAQKHFVVALKHLDRLEKQLGWDPGGIPGSRSGQPLAAMHERTHPMVLKSSSGGT